jgi:hypothetical protein
LNYGLAIAAHVAASDESVDRVVGDGHGDADQFGQRNRAGRETVPRRREM